MKKFTVITKDGSKWLERVPDVPVFGNESEWMEQVLEEDMPYLGSRPDGTVLSEEEVREIKQYSYAPNSGVWADMDEVMLQEDRYKKRVPYTIRTAYMDAEPDYDAEDHIHKHEWPSTRYVARKMDVESHDRHISEDYWRKRCESAEKLIGMEPSDPKTYDEFCRLREEWDKIVKQEPK